MKTGKSRAFLKETQREFAPTTGPVTIKSGSALHRLVGSQYAKSLRHFKEDVQAFHGKHPKMGFILRVAGGPYKGIYRPY